MVRWADWVRVGVVGLWAAGTIWGLGLLMEVLVPSHNAPLVTDSAHTPPAAGARECCSVVCRCECPCDPTTARGVCEERCAPKEIQP